MGRIWMPGGGGGADLDVVTAEAPHVLAGKVIVDKDGNPLTGTMPNQGAKTAALNCGGSYAIPAGYHNGNGKVTANSLASQTPGTATAAQILSGKTAWVNGAKVTGTIASLAGGTKTPTTSQQTISCKNKYMTSDIVIPAFTLPAAASIKKGVTVTIYGKSVTGTWEGYATSPLYLYNKGTWGGLSTTGATIVAEDSSLIAQKSNKFVFGYSGYGSGSQIHLDLFRLNQSFNLTSYNYIKIVECGVTWNELVGGVIEGGDDLHTDGYICVGVSSSALSSVSTPSSVTGTPSGLTKYAYGNGTVVLDVSSLSGNYWIYFGGIRNQGTSFKANGLNQVFVSTS